MKKMEATAPQKKKKSQSSAIGTHVTTPTKTKGPTRPYQKTYQKQVKMDMTLQMKKMETTAPRKKKKIKSTTIGIHMAIVTKARGPTKLHQNKQKEMKINILLQMKKRKATPREKRLRMMTPQRKVPTL